MAHDTDQPGVVRLAWGLVALAALLPFLSLLGADFVRWDDTHNFFENPRMLEPSLANAAWYWTHPYKDLYVPVTYTAWELVASLAQTHPATGGVELNSYVFHAFNLLLHLGAASAAFALLRAWTSTLWPAALGAMLFAVHPIQVEPVAWSSGAKDLLAGLFGLASLGLFTLHLQHRCWRAYAAATLALILALLSKPSAVVVPAIALLAAVAIVRIPLRTALARLVPWFLLCLPILLLARRVQTTANTDPAPLLFRPVVALDALGFYIRQIFVPLNYAIDYGRSPQWLMQSPQRYFTWTIPILVLVIALLLRKRLRVLLIATAIFILALLPTLGLVTFDFQSYSTTTDHYAYLAMLAPALVLAALLRRASRIGYSIAAGLIAILAIRAGVQALVWQNSQALFEHTVAVNPTSLAGNVNLANPLADQAMADSMNGARRETQFSARAIPFYKRALEASPHDFGARKSLANMYKAQQRWSEAEAAYRQALQDARNITPDLLAEARTNLAVTLANQNRFPEALAELDRALRETPDYAPAHALRQQIQRRLR